MSLEKSDIFLLKELQSGNPRAFEKIFRENYLRLCQYSNTFVRDEDKAQSLAQNVFLKLWETKHTFERIENITPYLLSMVRNESINYLKREKRQIKLAYIPESNTEAPVEQQLEHNELLEQLILALDSMPARCRQAFELSRFEYKTYREISDIMGINVKAVEALLTRSMKLLRKSMVAYLPSKNNTILPFLLIMFKKMRFLPRFNSLELSQ